MNPAMKAAREKQPIASGRSTGTLDKSTTGYECWMPFTSASGTAVSGRRQPVPGHTLGRLAWNTVRDHL